MVESVALVAETVPETLVAQLRRVAAGGGIVAGDVRPGDAWLTAGMVRAQLHEVYAATPDDAAAATGFALALALAAGALPALWVRIERDERGGGRPYAAGLAELGLPPESLVLVLVPDEPSLLRVAADAARCPGLGLVLVESRGRAAGLDLTATRRLMLAAEASGVTVLSVRIGADPVASAAATRWGVAAATSGAIPGSPDVTDSGAGAEGNVPGLPAFDVECLRRRGGPAGTRWRVEWNRETRCFEPLDPHLEIHAGSHGAQPALAGAGLSVAVGGTAARDATASVRRAG
jgi:protein ImuA